MLEKSRFPQPGTILSMILIIVLVLVSLPFTNNFMLDAKLYGLALGSILMFGLYLLQSFNQKRLVVTLSPYTLAGLALAISTSASIFFTSNYPVENLLGFGLAYIASALIIIFGDRTLDKNSVSPILKTIFGSAIVLSISVVLDYLNFGFARLLNIIAQTELPQGTIVNLTGSHVIGLQFSVVALLLFILTRKYLQPSRIARIIIPLFLVVSIGFQTHAIWPGQPGEVVLPNANASWSIALDAIRFPRQALIGVGPGAYINAYNSFKPAWINNTDQWAFDFSQARSLPLTVLTTMGFLGLIAWFILALQSVRHFTHTHDLEKTISGIALLILASFLFLPMSIVMLGIFSILVALSIALKDHERETISIHALSIQSQKQQHQPKINQTVSVIATSLLVVLCFGSIYLISRAYFAEVSSFQAGRALQKDNAVEAYELQQRAIRLNPYLDYFRRDYATTNLLIAIALSNKADITEAESQQVGELLQQAIREARAATTLDPADTRNWLVLAQIYQNMIGVADDAQTFAVQAFSASIETAPANPAIYVQLGQLLEAVEQVEQAATLYNQAINIKPDFAPAHYQLALIFEQVNQLESARLSYQRLLTILEPDSEDYIQVNTQLEDLNKRIEELADQIDDTQLNQASSSQGSTPGSQGSTTGRPENAQGSDDSASPAPTTGSPTPTNREGTTGSSILERNIEQNLESRNPVNNPDRDINLRDPNEE